MRRIAALVAIATLSLTACGGGEVEPDNTGRLSQISIAVSDNGGPKLSYDLGREYKRSESRIEWEGSGGELVEGGPLLIHVYAESLADGTVLEDTYASLPSAYLMSPDYIGVELYDALEGHQVGTRVVLLSPPDKGDEPVQTEAILVVVDVLPTRAVGEALGTRDTQPIVLLGRNGEPSITLRGNAPPTELQVITLIQGDGPQIENGSLVAVNYLGVKWSDGSVLDSSWVEGRAPYETPIGLGHVIQGWEQGLIDQTQGSQVMLIVPPNLAYGDDTLVYVIDILAVSGAK